MIHKLKFNRLQRNYIYNLAYQILVLLTPLITAPYLAKVLGAEKTGVYSYVHSFTVTICTIVMLGIYNYGSRQIAYVRDNEQDILKVFGRIISARILIACVGTFIYFSLVKIIGRYNFLFFIYYSYFLGYLIDCTWLFVGLEDMKWVVLKNAIMRIISVLGIFLLVKKQDDLKIYILIQGMSSLLSNLLAGTQIKKYISTFQLDFSYLKKDIFESAKLFLPSVASTLYTQCDKIMIELMTGATNEVSFYDYAEKIIIIPMSFITVLNNVVMPRLANEFKKNNKNNIVVIVNKVSNFSMFLAFPIAFGLMATADKLIPWFLGEEFIPSIIAIRILAFTIISNSLSGISGSQFFTATNQLNIMIKSQFIALFGNIAINALLIPSFGFIGAAIATLITSTICSCIQYYYLLKQIRIPGFFKKMLKYFLFSLIMFLIIRVSTNRLDPSIMTNFIQVIVGMSVYFFLCFISKCNGFIKDKKL